MKKAIMAIASLILMILATTACLAADGNPSVRIDGQVKSFNPPSQILNNRIMVPMRFVIEDPALQGMVQWNGNTNQVSVVCRNRNLTFTIGSAKVLVDGQVKYLDAAPYIYQDRTFLPLRFLAENLGGSVTWNESRQEANINFGQAGNTYDPEVFAYYYVGGFPELQQNASLLTDVALRWFETDADGNLAYEYQDNYQKVLRYLDDRGINSHASVVFMDKAGLHTLLSSPTRRSNLINQLAQQVASSGYDGVNIDFEFIDPVDSAYFTAFLQELKNRLGSDKVVSCAVFARTGTEKWPTAYNYRAIGGIVDKMVVMTYDYSYKESPAGPIAPLWWVEKVVDYMVEDVKIPAGKLLIGMATYGYNWAPGQTTTTVTKDKLNSLEASCDLVENFDWNSMSPYYTYYDSSGTRHQIWLENQASLEKKWQVVENHQLGGISFWRIGNGFTDLYRLLEANQD